jgi:hypothetical protein
MGCRFLTTCFDDGVRAVTKKIVLASLLCLMLAPQALAESIYPDIASAEWSVKAPHSLKDNPPENNALWLFMNRQWNPSVDESELTPGNGKLCSFRFADLRRTGYLSLVAVYDLGGTADCNSLSVFDKTSAGIERYDYSGALVFPDENNQSVVKDAGGNGRLELVVFDRLAALGEDRIWAEEWPSIYDWTGTGYTNVSPKYVDYYRNWLASLKKEIAGLETARERAANATPKSSGQKAVVTGENGVASEDLFGHQQPPVSPNVGSEAESPYELDAKRAQAAKIERFLGAKDAGLTDAIRWANSADPLERTLAAQVMAQTGLPDGLTYEQTLGHDTDRKVAEFASYRITHWGAEDPYQAGTFDLVAPNNP